MKQIQVPPEQLGRSITDEPLLTEQGTQVVFRFSEFVLGRLVDPVFIEGKENAIEAAILVLRTKERVEKELQEHPEVLNLEDDQFNRLLKACQQPTGGFLPYLQHLLVPFLLAIQEGKDV